MLPFCSRGFPVLLSIRTPSIVYVSPSYRFEKLTTSLTLVFGPYIAIESSVATSIALVPILGMAGLLTCEDGSPELKYTAAPAPSPSIFLVYTVLSRRYPAGALVSRIVTVPRGSTASPCSVTKRESLPFTRFLSLSSAVYLPEASLVVLSFHVRTAFAFSTGPTVS